MEVGKGMMFVDGKLDWKVGVKDGLIGALEVEVPGKLVVVTVDKLDPPMGAVKKDAGVVDTLVPLEVPMK